MNRKQWENYGIIPSIIYKVIYIGDIQEYQSLPVFCKIDYKNGKLSITGVIRPTKNGDADICGQILETIKDNIDIIHFSEGFNKINTYTFIQYWHDWHLNYMRAGTLKQENFIKEWESKGNIYNYDIVCELLKKNNLYNDDDYIYGSKWLKEEVPANILNFLASLPESKVIPAWV